MREIVYQQNIDRYDLGTSPKLDLLLYKYCENDKNNKANSSCGIYYKRLSRNKIIQSFIISV